jgi:hypothetical protein
MQDATATTAAKKNKDMVCTKLLFLDLFSLKCLLCIPAEEKTVAG